MSILSSFKRFIKSISFKGRAGLGSFPIQIPRKKTSEKKGFFRIYVGRKTTPQTVMPIRLCLGFMAFVVVVMFGMLILMTLPLESPIRSLSIYSGAFIILSLIFLVVLFAVSYGVRRLHDVGKSGWYLLLPLMAMLFAALIGAVFSFFSLPGPMKAFLGISLSIINAVALGYTWKLLLQEGQPFPNRYGPPPKKKNQD